jgi:starch synthase
MTANRHSPRILIVTPEVSVVPRGMGPESQTICARAGGLGDICASQIHALYEQGMDVHLAMPNYRNMFKINAQRMPGIDIRMRRRELPKNRIHLAQDRSFYYHPKLFLTLNTDNIRIALAFQREVINRIIPEVQPDLIHCFDWMTGLIPAMARQINIPCLFTLYRTDSPRLLLATMEERGIDTASFWQHCYYTRMPINYWETRDTNPVDMLTSGVFSARAVITLSETFQKALIDNGDSYISSALKTELGNKMRAGCLSAIAPTPDTSFNPANDRSLMRTYEADNHYPGKLFNKLHLQETLNLVMDSAAPICFWPTRLEGSRPGCRLMADTLAAILERYRELRLQIIFIADGDFQNYLHALIDRLHAADRVAACDFDARRYRLAYAGSDFVLMPLCRDPVALPCKIGQRYGSLPIAYDGGAIHDCFTHLDAAADRGNGFLFRHFDQQGLLWAMDQAMVFYRRPAVQRTRQVRRIMADSLASNNTDEWVQQLMNGYASLLEDAPWHDATIARQMTDSRIAA